jgi:hypothetical protein
MSNELKHVSVGLELSQVEFESAGLHVMDGQTAGDMVLASNGAQLSRHPYIGRNVIINGCGIIDQRAVDYTLVKDTYGIRADRFYGMATGTAVSAGVLTKTNAANCGASGHAFKFSGVTLTGTGIIYFRYRIEAKDAIRFKNKAASFSCKVYHDVGNAINYTVYVRKANTADVFSAVTEISNSGVISVGSAAETKLAYLGISMGDCSNGVEIEIKVECGAVATRNFEFTECQFESGSFYTYFEFRPLAQELMLCQRYYEKSYDYATAPGTATNNGASWLLLPASSTGAMGLNSRFSVNKRTNPTVTLYDSAGTSGKCYKGGNGKTGIADMIGTGGFRGYTNDNTDTQEFGYQWAAVAEL